MVKAKRCLKSLGNTVDPNKVVHQYGADILRLWASSIDYQQDVRISDEILKQVIDMYKKIRNTFRFMLGNVSDLTQADLIAFENLNAQDQYMMNEINEVLKTCVKAYQNFDYKTVTSTISNFMNTMLSAYYLDYTKDILYIEKQDGPQRRGVQTVVLYSD